MKKVYAIIIGICIGFMAQGQECFINENTTIAAGETRTCTDLKIAPNVTLTVDGTLLLPEGYTMSSGVLNIARTGIVHIQKEFILTSEPNLLSKVEVINEGILELWGDESAGKFEMRPNIFGTGQSPWGGINSVYFTNNGKFNVKNAEFIIGKGSNESGGAFFYNEDDALIYVDNDEYNSGKAESEKRNVWLGGKNGSGDDVAFGMSDIPEKHALDQQQNLKPEDYNQQQFRLFLNEGSSFIVKNTDANMTFAQKGNKKQSIWGKFYVYDGDLSVSFDNNSGGQSPVIEKDGGLFVFDTTPSDEDQKGMLKINAGGGDMQWAVEGQMYSTGFEAINPSSSGSNEIDVKDGGTVFIGNVGANAPSENYKMHVEGGGSLYYCGNYSGGGDMIGRVDTGGNLFYAGNYYDYDHSNTDESNPNSQSRELLIYDGPLMNDWRLIDNNTQLTNGTDVYNLYTNEITPYFTINDASNHEMFVSLYTPQGMNAPKSEYCIVESDWYLNEGKFTNGTLEYDTFNAESLNDYYEIGEDGKATLYEYRPAGLYSTEITIIESDWTINENGELINTTIEADGNTIAYKTFAERAALNDPYYEINESGAAEVYEIEVGEEVFTISLPKGELASYEKDWEKPAVIYQFPYDYPSSDLHNKTFRDCSSANQQNGVCFTEVDGNIIFTFKDKRVSTYTPELKETILIASDWQFGVENKIVNTKNPEEEKEYVIQDGVLKIVKSKHFEKIAEHDVRSEWQIKDGVLVNTNGTEEYETYNEESQKDYYVATLNEDCILASVYEYSEISFNKEDIAVVTSGWYFDGDILKNVSKQNLPSYFDHTKGIKPEGVSANIGDHTTGGSGTANKKVLWYETTEEGNVRIYSYVDDFFAAEGASVSTMEGVTSSIDCEKKFLDIAYPVLDGFLPVTLTKFQAAATPAGGARIEWATQTETNNDYFTLYRSYNGIVFEAIAHKSGAGTTTNPQMYDYNDNDIIPNIAYYKLEQTDYNGETTMSNVVAVQNLYLSTFEIETMQNNGNGNYSFSFLFPDNERENHIVIYNIMSVKRAEYTFAAGNISAQADANLYPGGTYIVEHTNGVRKTIKKIVVK